MAKLTISDFNSLGNETSFLTALNAAFELIEAAMENTVSRDGTTPNDMSAALDLNGNPLLNTGNIDLAVAGQLTAYTTEERDLIPLGVEDRLLIWNSDEGAVQQFDGSTWTNVRQTPAELLLTDVDNHFTTDDVESALAELATEVDAIAAAVPTQIVNGDASVAVNGSGDVTIVLSSGRNLIVTGLPTADPTVEGALWIDTDTLKVSAG